MQELWDGLTFIFLFCRTMHYAVYSALYDRKENTFFFFFKHRQMRFHYGMQTSWRPDANTPAAEKKSQ